MSGYVYFMCGEADGHLLVKIGYTSAHPERRLREIQGMSPLQLEIFGFIRGGQALERKFHRTFAPVRSHGEWFVAEGKLYDFVHYLAGYGAANRATTADELECAVDDCILANWAPHPSVDEAAYLASADASEWGGLLQ